MSLPGNHKDRLCIAADEEKIRTDQRPGKLGVDYDESGAEMAPGARVWKKYVEEADETDKELVGGWNKLLDIILIVFAALFSAISTAFVMESSKDLKPDHAAASAQSLLLISQILLVSSNKSLTDISLPVGQSPAPFTPPRSAIIVNTLWFMSLSLSVAASLIAILAKEWCHSFISGRTGSILRQGRLRQQRWNGIERWKMKGILSLLPLLMHTALMLFAIGLSVSLWELNMQVALPVIIIAGLVTLFYIVTATLPLFFGFCPYKTALTTFLYPYWIPFLKISLKAALFVLRLSCLPGYYIWKVSHMTWKGYISPKDRNSGAEAWKNGYSNWKSVKVFLCDGQGRLEHWAKQLLNTYSTDRTALTERETPMDETTSLMLSWMITNCEESQSVDLALQALAGAKLWLPRESLWQCDALRLCAQRLKACLEALDNPHLREKGVMRDNLLDSACLYSRSLNFLMETIQGEAAPPKRAHHVQSALDQLLWPMCEDVQACLTANTLIKHALEPIPRYDIVAMELGNTLIRSPLNEPWVDGRRKFRYRAQCEQQQELLLKIIRKETTLSRTATLALIDSIAKSYLLIDKLLPPFRLIDLFDTSLEEAKLELLYTIGVCLATATFANHDYPDAIKNPTQNCNYRVERAQGVYFALRSKEPEPKETKSLLIFGLLGLLVKSSSNMNDDKARAKSISRVLDTVLDNSWMSKPTGTSITVTYQGVIPTLPPDFAPEEHFHSIILSWLLPGLQVTESLDWLDTVIRSSLWRVFSGAPLMISLLKTIKQEHFESRESSRMCQVCLLGYLEWGSKALSTTPLLDLISILSDTGLDQNFIRSTTLSFSKLAPLYMSFTWLNAIEIIAAYNAQRGDAAVRANLLKILQSFDTLDRKGVPVDVGGMGFADQWICILLHACTEDPRGVDESKILSHMVEFYKSNPLLAVAPSTLAKLPNQFRNRDGVTWLELIQELKELCKVSVEPQPERSREREETGLEGHVCDKSSGTTLLMRTVCPLTAICLPFDPEGCAHSS